MIPETSGFCAVFSTSAAYVEVPVLAWSAAGEAMVATRAGILVAACSLPGFIGINVPNFNVEVPCEQIRAYEGERFRKAYKLEPGGKLRRSAVAP